jgi:pimeloyl-ACP methyl ester carboxylesterase
MPQFALERHLVAGIDTAVLIAGDGPPLVFLHGAGTMMGFDPLLPLARSFRLIVPQHPGFGASADDPSVASINDYVLHYLDLFDLLELERFSLVGHSLGGHLAARFAIEQNARVTRLVLASPAGLRVAAHPMRDPFTLSDEEALVALSARPGIFADKIPQPMTPEFVTERYREQTSAARIAWSSPFDAKLPRWLHRLTMPTMILWGEDDGLLPAGQAAAWAELIPGATVVALAGVGHLMFDESEQALDAVAEFLRT